MAQSDVYVRQEGRGSSLGDYWPLISLIFTSLLAAIAIAGGYEAFNLPDAMRAYMGIFLTIFALLKIFNLSKFADGFQMYDLAAKRSRAYALAYPFIELALGLWWFSGTAMTAAAVVTAALFLFGAVGVIKALREGLDIECPCMGSILSVPLSTVTLTEDLGMAAMAIVMLLL